MKTKQRLPRFSIPALTSVTGARETADPSASAVLGTAEGCVRSESRRHGYTPNYSQRFWTGVP
jgi:hypothetical protein